MAVLWQPFNASQPAAVATHAPKRIALALPGFLLHTQSQRRRDGLEKQHAPSRALQRHRSQNESLRFRPAGRVRVDLVDLLQAAGIAHLGQIVVIERDHLALNVLVEVLVDCFWIAADFDGENVRAVVCEAEAAEGFGDLRSVSEVRSCEKR